MTHCVTVDFREFVLANLAVDETAHKGPIILGRCVGSRVWVFRWQSYAGAGGRKSQISPPRTHV